MKRGRKTFHYYSDLDLLLFFIVVNVFPFNSNVFNHTQLDLDIMMHCSREPSAVILSISNSSLSNFFFAILPGFIYICMWLDFSSLIYLYINYLLLTAASYCLQHNLEFNTAISAGNVLFFSSGPKVISLW